ncbi:MAG: YgiT-type zinc finger protein [Bacteroidota bacterium]
MNSKEDLNFTEKGPIPRAVSVIPVEVNYKPITPAETVIPCGCKEGKILQWGKFSHMIYTIHGEQMEIKEITGYKCNNCGLVLLLPDAADAINEGVEKAVRSHDRVSA